MKARSHKSSRKVLIFKCRESVLFVLIRFGRAPFVGLLAMLLFSLKIIAEEICSRSQMYF